MTCRPSVGACRAGSRIIECYTADAGGSFPIPEHRMPYRVARRAWLIAIAAVLPSPHANFLRAQQPAQTIPVELATAYVRSVARTDSAAAVEFLPGEVPAAVREMIPVLPGSRVVGSVVVDRTTTVVGTTT